MASFADRLKADGKNDSPTVHLFVSGPPDERTVDVVAIDQPGRAGKWLTLLADDREAS